MRRYKNIHSLHSKGRALDILLDDDVIDFLVSLEGQRWLNHHGITFYIEGKPNSKRVASYLSDPVRKEYVFFNVHATGDHIHLQI